MKKLLKLLPISLLLVAFLIEPTFAQESTNNIAQETLAKFQQLAGVMLSLLNLVMWPILAMIGGLMGNDLVFGPQVEDRLLLIWSQVRNLINLAFVLVLVGIALYNVAGIGEEGNYTIKKILPKFIIALIVVNFTFFAAKVVLSSVNVITTAVFALPNSVESNFSRVDANAIAAKTCSVLRSTYEDNSLCLDDQTFTPKAQQFFSTFSADNVAYLMAINLANISDINKVSDLVRETPSLQNVTVNILLNLVLYFIYAVSFIVLFIVLIVRVVVLWFVIALSPLIAVQIVFPEGLKAITGEFDIQDLFLKHAFAPVIIGFGMTAGYLMLDAYKQNSAPSLGSSLQIGEDFANAFSTSSTGLQEIMIGLAAAAIVWKVTFAAAEGTLAKGITESIKSGISGTAGRIAALPKYMQWIPIPANLDPDGGGTTSLRSLASTFDQRMRNIESRGNQPLGGRSADYYRSYAERPDGTVDQHIELLRTTQDTDTQRLTRQNLERMLLELKDAGRITDPEYTAITAQITPSDNTLADIINDDTRGPLFTTALNTALTARTPANTPTTIAGLVAENNQNRRPAPRAAAATPAPAPVVAPPVVAPPVAAAPAPAPAAPPDVATANTNLTGALVALNAAPADANARTALETALSEARASVTANPSDPNITTLQTAITNAQAALTPTPPPTGP